RRAGRGGGTGAADDADQRFKIAIDGGVGERDSGRVLRLDFRKPALCRLSDVRKRGVAVLAVDSAGGHAFNLLIVVRSAAQTLARPALSPVRERHRRLPVLGEQKAVLADLTNDPPAA